MPDFDGKGPRQRSPLAGLKRGLKTKKPIKAPVKYGAKHAVTAKNLKGKGNLRITRIKKK